MKRWKVLDAHAGIYSEKLDITASMMGPGAGECSASFKRLSGGRSDDVDRVLLDNGYLRLEVLPTRGLGVWKAWLTRDGGEEMEIGWQSPTRGPVHPKFVPLMEPSGLGWLDGFDELFVRCGLHSNGAPDFDESGRLLYPLHGRIANTPAHAAEVFFDESERRLGIVGEVDETRLFFSKLRLTASISTAVGEAGFRVQDTVTNLSAEPGEMQLLYHINFGAPFCAPGSRLVAPVWRMAPRDAVAVADLATWDQYGPEAPGAGESVFFFQLRADDAGRTSVALVSPSGDLGVRLSFNIEQLPYFIVWKNRQAAADGYVTGLEPAANLPNPRSFEQSQGRVLSLKPHESCTFETHLTVLDGADQIAAATQEIEALVAGQGREILEKPDAAWSASV